MLKLLCILSGTWWAIFVLPANFSFSHLEVSVSCSLRNVLLGSHTMSFRVVHPISRLSGWSFDPDPPSESTLTTLWVQRRALDRQSQHHGRGRLIFQMGWLNYSEAFSAMPVTILPSQELSRK